MLDPWIIEEIRRREERDQRDDRPVLELPLPPPEEEEETTVREDDKVERGVVIVDYCV